LTSATYVGNVAESNVISSTSSAKHVLSQRQNIAYAQATSGDEELENTLPHQEVQDISLVVDFRCVVKDGRYSTVKIT